MVEILWRSSGKSRQPLDLVEVRGGYDHTELRSLRGCSVVGSASDFPSAVRSRGVVQGLSPKTEENPEGVIGISSLRGFAKPENRDLKVLEIPRKNLSR